MLLIQIYNGTWANEAANYQNHLGLARTEAAHVIPPNIEGEGGVFKVKSSNFKGLTDLNTWILEVKVIADFTIPRNGS